MDSLSLFIQAIAAYIITVTAAITLEAPKVLIYKTGFIGAIGYLSYLILITQGIGKSLSTFYACLLVALMGQLFARILKAPVTMFYIPAFFPFVPGSAIYLTALYFIQGDYTKSNQYLIETLTIAGAIALGVFISDSIIEIYNQLYTQRK